MTTTMTASGTIKCGNCKGRHETVAQVRQCYAGLGPDPRQPLVVTDRLHVGHAPAWPIDREYAKEYEARLTRERDAEAAAAYREQRSRLYPGTASETADRQYAKTKITVGPGVYELDGIVYVVKASKSNKGRVYASRIVESPNRLNENGDHVEFEFVYDRGAVYQLEPEMKMSTDRAKHFLIRYGRCLVCRRALKAAASVERGIGPVCVKYFA